MNIEAYCNTCRNVEQQQRRKDIAFQHRYSIYTYVYHDDLIFVL